MPLEEPGPDRRDPSGRARCRQPAAHVPVLEHGDAASHTASAFVPEPGETDDRIVLGDVGMLLSPSPEN